jgi:Mce-associated membrane protein
MRSRKQTPSELNGDHVEDAAMQADSATVDALTLAEAEAAEADAVAAAARARAKALRLRSEAEAAKAAETVEPPEPEDDSGLDDDVEHAKDEVAAADGDESDDVVTVAADNDAAEEPAEEPATERRGVRIRIPLPSWKAVAAALTILIIAALLAASGWMYMGHRQAVAEQQRRAEFQAAARQGVVTLMSLDYNKAKEDVQRIIDSSTGQFKTDFQNTAEDFVKVATDSKAVTETNVTATAVESMTRDTATVLVAATSRVTNAAGAKQEPRAWRLSVNMARDGGQLKLAKVEFVP